ncbi:MAG: hypothetical protein FWG09_03145, partial [Synergistaceae bacterium]|nr:hypothetical protein [Synergistaceae bacterium]
KKFFSVSVLLFLITLCLAAYADEKKILVAIIDFADETPNKMLMAPSEKTEDGRAHFSEVMRIIRELTENSGLFELLPYETVAKAMDTDIGKEAAARRYDPFSAARLGKALEADVILTGQIVRFEKNNMPAEFNITINNLDFSNKGNDVVIRARLISAKSGAELADITGAGFADENILENVSAAVVNRLSAGFTQAAKISVLKILRELGSTDIMIDMYAPPPLSERASDITNFTVVKTEGGGKYIHINAGRNKGVSIADLFTVLKNDAAGELKPVAVYSVSMVDINSSRLALVEPEDAASSILVGDKAQRKRSRD